MTRTQGTLIAYLIVLLFIGASSACRSRSKNSGATVKSSGVPIGQFKGYNRINSLIKSRLLDAGSSNRYFDLGYVFLGGASRELAILMGDFTEATGRPSYVNGEPNPVSMMLWDTALTGFSESIGGYCPNGPTDSPRADYPLNARGAQLVKAICSNWPNGLTDAQLHDLWTWVMSFDAPESAETEWKASILDAGSPLRQMPAKAGIKAMMRTIFLNPWFLLET